MVSKKQDRNLFPELHTCVDETSFSPPLRMVAQWVRMCVTKFNDLSLIPGMEGETSSLKLFSDFHMHIREFWQPTHT